jgi:hypothetical protein
MNTTSLTRRPKLWAALLIGSLLLTACAPALAKTTPQPTATNLPATSAPAATAEPLDTNPTATPSSLYTLDNGSLAASIQMETVAAVSASSGAPYWDIMPAYTRLTLQGYPIANHRMLPQIFIYPSQDLAATNEAAGKIVAGLQSLIESPRDIPEMPLLPLSNDRQVMHTHLQYLDFKNGQGLRYLAQLDQGIVPINNRELIYVYQGLTSDGNYYVSAVLPVTHPSLPADERITGQEPPEFTDDFARYVAQLSSALNVQAPDTFTPDLTKLDAMMSSIEIR